MPTVKASEEIAVQMYITQNITVFNYPNFNPFFNLISVLQKCFCVP